MGGILAVGQNVSRVRIEARDADVRAVLQIFAKQTDLNVSVAEGVIGSVTVNLKDLPYPDALDAILHPLNFSWYAAGKTIVVRADPVKQEVRVFSLKYARAKDMANLLTGTVGDDGSISHDPYLNAITVRAHPSVLSQIEQIILKVDTKPSQVLVEANIIELKVGDDSNLGVDLVARHPADPQNLVGQSSGMANRGSVAKAAIPPTKGFFAQAVSANWEAFVETLRKRTDFNLLASPKVLATNHEKATISVGDRIGYLVSTTTQVAVQQQVEFLEVGTKLDFTPHITSDGEIVMDVRPEVSEGSISGGVPSKSSTETTSRVVVRDGESIVIGGLIRKKDKETAYGIPILMDIPFIGTLFRRTEIEN